MGSMTLYRFYCLGPDGHITEPPTVPDFPDDRAAIEAAEALVEAPQIGDNREPPLPDLRSPSPGGPQPGHLCFGRLIWWPRHQSRPADTPEQLRARVRASLLRRSA